MSKEELMEAYKTNQDVKDYVDKFAENAKVTVDEAFEYAMVREYIKAKR